MHEAPEELQEADLAEETPEMISVILTSPRSPEKVQVVTEVRKEPEVVTERPKEETPEKYLTPVEMPDEKQKESSDKRATVEDVPEIKQEETVEHVTHVTVVEDSDAEKAPAKDQFAKEVEIVEEIPSIPEYTKKELEQEGETTTKLEPEEEEETYYEPQADSIRERTPLSLYTTHVNNQFVTSIDLDSRPVVEGVHPKDDSQGIRDELIDEHTAGPPAEPPSVPSAPVEPVEELTAGAPDTKDDLSLVSVETEKSLVKYPTTELEVMEEWYTIYELLKRKQKLREESAAIVAPSAQLLLPSSKQPSGDEQNTRVDENIVLLQDAIKKKDVVVVQKVIITIVETVTTWLETIEYRIYVIRNTEDVHERAQQYEHLRNELHIVEEKLTILEDVTQSAVEILSEETIVTIRETVRYLRQQVSHVEKVRQAEEKELTQDEESYAQYLTAVDDAEKEVSDLKSQLAVIQDTQMQPEEKVAKLETILTSNEEMRDRITELLLNSHDLRRTPGRQVGTELATIQTELCDIHDSVEKELDRLLRLTTTTTEYEETLMELTHLIEMAESILEARVVARDLDHLTDTIAKHKKLFLSLRQCQKVLESLDTCLEPSSRVHYQQLYSRSYLRASVLLDKATQRNHQLSLLRGGVATSPESADG
ncbi:COP1-interactive protein 1-like [Penaeus monodon]|uniref:COP1-interactive protein 1-like n=1 Tax=Penaeus monodon TaxID=6687 RepID=UPI0018A71499|nr:COP1-interactive protein 1-like [Penaeus monodon]